MRLGGLLVVCALVCSAATKPVRLEVKDGSLEFVWLSSSTFKATRSWHINRAIPSSADLDLETDALRVHITAGTLAIRVVTAAGKPLAEFDPPGRAPGKVVWSRTLMPGERTFGASGASSTSPFFFSSVGFGQSFDGASKYLLDFSKPDRVLMTSQGSDKIDLFFMYGPTPKEIFEQRKFVSPIPDSLPRRRLDLNALTCAEVRKLNDASLTGTLVYDEAGPQWTTFLGAYLREIHDRGLPTIRPLVMQFPRDPNAYKYTDVTMFGDEMLLAPKCAGPVTLPQGLWTDLKTDVEHKGRSSVALVENVTTFVRNGSIVPIRRGALVELHYFPKLPAEFFIFEPDVSDYSQVHASEAADFWRLEIESKVARTYEWVLHHIGENPKRIRVDVKAGEDHIINLPL